MRGLVLEGGGAKGAYQIGACLALREMGITYTAVAGTSIGAINGAIVAQGDLDKAHDLWYNISLSKVFDVRDEYLEAIKKFELDQEGWGYFLSRARDILNNRGLDTTLMKRILQENIDEARLRQAGVLFGMVTVSLTDRKPLEIFLEDIPPGQLVNYLMASASLPIFKLEKIGDKEYLDGGFYDNLPVKLLYSKGYREIVAIRTHGLGRIRKLRAPDLKLISIEPKEDIGTVLDFSQAGARRNLLLGYYDARKTMQGLRGIDYYIQPGCTKQDYARFLLELDEEDIRKGAGILGVKGDLFEHLLPRILELAPFQTDNIYEGAVLVLCEALAKKYGVERFQLYTFEQFINLLAAKHQEARPISPEKEPGYELNWYAPLLSRARRAELLEKAAVALFDKMLRTKGQTAI